MTESANNQNLEQVPQKKPYHKSILKQNLPKPRNYKHKAKMDVRRKSIIIANEMLKGESATQACITAGYSIKTPVTQIMNNQIVKQTFNDILEKTGLTDDAIAEKLKSLFHAKTTKFFADKGVVTDQREVNDNTIQLDTAKTLLKVKGHITDKTSIEVPGIEDILEQIANRRK